MKTNKEKYPYPLHPSYYSPTSLLREGGDYIERGLRRDEDIASESPMPSLIRWHDEK